MLRFSGTWRASGSWPQVANPRLANTAFRDQLREYCDTQYELYRAIQLESKADVIVDASKAIAPLIALRNEPRIDLRVLHLVRDVRGVSYSWAKSNVRRPHATDQGRETMASFSVWRTAARWTRMEAQSAVAGALIKPSATVRYEDLVTASEATTYGALRELGLEHFIGQANHLHGQVALLPSSHGISGNPSRFTTGEVTLRADEEWRSALSRRDRLTATALGMPALLGHGYLRRADSR